MHVALDKTKGQKQQKREGTEHLHEPSETGIDGGEDDEKRRRKVVQWDDAETEFLALGIHQMRRKDPGAHVVPLLNRVQKQLPSDRRRNITTVGQFEPVLRRLQEIDDQIWDDHKNMIRYRKKVEEQRDAPTRAEIFSSVTDEELIEFFQERVLDNITPAEVVSRIDTETVLDVLPLPQVAAFVTSRQMEYFNMLRDTETLMWDICARLDGSEQHHQDRNNNTHPVSRQVQDRNNSGHKKPKVVFYGLLPREQQDVMARLGRKIRYHFVDKNRVRDVMPSEADIIVLWARFTSHAIQKAIKKNIPDGCQLIILPRGGVGEMVAQVNKALRKFPCHA